MRENGIKGRVSRVTTRRPNLRAFHTPGDNLRLHIPAPIKPNEQWVADITYLKVGQRDHHLITVMDVYSRRILGWSLCKTRTGDDVLQVVKRVIARRRPKPGLIFHTDQGVEFRAQVLREELRRNGIRQSFNRLGYCTDNAHMESFYHSFKMEHVRGKRFSHEPQLRRAVADYIDGFYNQSRLHSGIGFMSPREYERRAA